MDARTGHYLMSDSRHLPLARWLALAVPGSLLLGALGSQHIGGLAPCEMCHWQRWPHLAAVVLAGLAFMASSQSRLLVRLAALAVAVSGAIGVFHAGVEMGWWEGVTTCTAGASGASNAELLKSILAAPVVRCDQVQWSLFGVSLAGWNALISLPAAGVIAWLTTRR